MGINKKIGIVLGTVIILGLAASAVWFNFPLSSAKNNAPKTTGTLKITSASAKELLWGQQLGSPFEDLCTAIAVDGKGNSCIAGYTFGDIAYKNKGCNDILAASFDNTGKMLWSLQSGSDDFDKAKGVAFDPDGNALITGETSGKLSTDTSTGNIFLQKVDKAGKLIWAKQYGPEDLSSSNAIKVDSEGNIFIAGYTTGKMGATAFGSSDAILSKLDKDGKVIWTCQWGCDGNDEAKGITIDKDGYIYAIGETNGAMEKTNKGGVDIFMSQISPEGKLLFNKQYGTDSAEAASNILVDKDKNVYLTGWTNGDFAAKQVGAGDAILLKVSNKGEELWKKQFGTELWDGVHSIIFSKSNKADIIVGGCQNYSDCQAFLRKYDADGKELWIKELDPAFSTCGREIGIDDEGYIYQTGGTHGKLFGTKKFEGETSDTFIYKTSEN